MSQSNYTGNLASRSLRRGSISDAPKNTLPEEERLIKGDSL